MMPSATENVLESFALNVMVRWDINVSHVAAVHGEDGHFDNSHDSMCWFLNLHTHMMYSIRVTP